MAQAGATKERSGNMTTIRSSCFGRIKDSDMDKYEEIFLEYAESEDFFPTVERLETFIQRQKEYERNRTVDK